MKCDGAGTVFLPSSTKSGHLILSLEVPDDHLWKDVSKKMSDDIEVAVCPLCRQRVVSNHACSNIPPIGRPT